MLDRTLMAVAAAVLAAPLADSPRNRFEVDSLYAKTFEQTYEFELDAITQTVNGVEVDLGEPVMTMSGERSYELADEYVKVEDDVLTRRRRTFEALAGRASMDLEVMGESDSLSATLSSPLEGETVLCDWDADEERHEFRFDEGSDGEASLLEGLLADAEFQLLPPSREVEQGDSWSIDLADQRAFFAPGGLPRWEPELSGDSGSLLEPWQMVAVSLICMSDASQEIDGELKARWTETVEVDGARAALITLELDADLTADVGEELTRMCLAAELDAVEATYEISWSVEGKGKLLWNLESGHFISLELECDNEIEFTLGLEQEFGEVLVEAEVSGPSTFEASAE